MTSSYSDLLSLGTQSQPLLQPGVHPFPDLLNLDAQVVLQRFKESQTTDFSRLMDDMEQPGNPLNRMLENLRQIAAKDPDNRFDALELFQPGMLRNRFLELHNHVMDHPVWLHPFFLRLFEADFDLQQATQFALHYFNQVKNTRQCVALALGRFSSLMPMQYGCLNERVSELAQIVLGQLLADEYGVAIHSIDSYPEMHQLLNATTHIVMYRRLLEGLGVPFEQQDVPLLPEVADNVLTQRLLAGHPDFSLGESLASVGLGMEWGVPEFFSLILGGLIRWGWQHQAPLNQYHLSVFIAHVQYDVLHAISVMLATSFFTPDETAISQIKQATNTLMSSRYDMMSGLYRHIFDESCPKISDIDLPGTYHLSDRRIGQALLKARQEIAPERMIDGTDYRESQHLPFVFKA